MHADLNTHFVILASNRDSKAALRIEITPFMPKPQPSRLQDLGICNSLFVCWWRETRTEVRSRICIESALSFVTS